VLKSVASDINMPLSQVNATSLETIFEDSLLCSEDLEMGYWVPKPLGLDFEEANTTAPPPAIGDQSAQTIKTSAPNFWAGTPGASKSQLAMYGRSPSLMHAAIIGNASLDLDHIPVEVAMPEAGRAGSNGTNDTKKQRCCLDTGVWVGCFLWGGLLGAMFAAQFGLILIFGYETIYYVTGWFCGSSGQMLLGVIWTSVVLGVEVLVAAVCLGIWDYASGSGEFRSGSGACRGMAQHTRKMFHDNWKYYACIVIFVVVNLQVKTYLLEPADSMLPTWWIADDVLDLEETNNCSFHAHWRDAKAFFANSSVDFSVVTVTVPKVQHPLASDKIAMASESNIYLFEDACTISAATLVHEIAHVWQFQSGSMFRVQTVFDLVAFPWSCRTWECIYDFGGQEGLNGTLQANPDAQITESFHIEQQAEIVAAFYGFWHQEPLKPGYSWGESKEYRDLLHHFAKQVLWK
jgi:hypothetical protein